MRRRVPPVGSLQQHGPPRTRLRPAGPATLFAGRGSRRRTRSTASCTDARPRAGHGPAHDGVDRSLVSERTSTCGRVSRCASRSSATTASPDSPVARRRHQRAIGEQDRQALCRRGGRRSPSISAPIGIQPRARASRASARRRNLYSPARPRELRSKRPRRAEARTSSISRKSSAHRPATRRRRLAREPALPHLDAAAASSSRSISVRPFVHVEERATPASRHRSARSRPWLPGREIERDALPHDVAIEAQHDAELVQTARRARTRLKHRGEPRPLGPERAGTSSTIAGRCCGFSLPASRTAAAWSRSSTACRPASRSTSIASRGSAAAPGRLRPRPADGIESDRAEFISGVRRGRTTGAPDRAADRQSRTGQLAADDARRGGRAGRRDGRATRGGRPPAAGARRSRRRPEVRARRSARRARARERPRDRRARGRRCVARQILLALDIDVVSHVTGIGDVVLPDDPPVAFETARDVTPASPLYCADPAAEAAMIAAIDRAREAGDTLGGSFEVIARGLPAGLGSHVQWDRKLDGRLAQALMSIPAIKAVGIGLGVEAARRPGSRVHDEIVAPRRRRRGRAGARAPDQSRRRTRRRRDQRRRASGVRLHEADLDADEAAALGRSDDARRSAGGDRAQRRLRRPGRRRRRRSRGLPRPRRCGARAVRRRLDAAAASRTSRDDRRTPAAGCHDLRRPSAGPATS